MIVTPETRGIAVCAAILHQRRGFFALRRGGRVKKAGRGFGVLRDNYITIPLNADKVKCGKYGV